MHYTYNQLTDSPFSGLINNVIYVIILSAALDLVGPTIPKGLVLLADVLPSFLVKLVAPYYIHVVPYSMRTVGCVLISFAGMAIIALTPDNTNSLNLTFKLSGVALASLSSGGGELSFLGLTHHFGHSSLAAWSSGTGAAGLVGAGAYVLATTTIGFSSRVSLLAFSFLPLIMLAGFFLILPRDLITTSEATITTSSSRYLSLPTSDNAEPSCPDEDDTSTAQANKSPLQRIHYQLTVNFQRSRSLFVPCALLLSSYRYSPP